MRHAIVAFILAGTVILAGCGGKSDSGSPTARTELLVSAAASLTDSLNEIRILFEKEHPDIRLTYNFASSGTLQRQIEQGAPADLFLSAGEKQLKALVDKRLIDESQHKGLLWNELVIVVSGDKREPIRSVADLVESEFGKIAIGEPSSVPAGEYTKETLEYYGVWGDLLPKLVYAKDVRQVLTYVETGNADAGFVYRTDAEASNQVRVASVIDSVSHRTIEYPVGIVKATRHPREAREFYEFLQGDRALGIFEKYGFSLPNERGNE